MKDQLDNILLNGSLLEDFKVRARWMGGEYALCLGEGRFCFMPAKSWVLFLHFEKEKWEDLNSAHSRPEGYQGLGQAGRKLERKGSWGLSYPIKLAAAALPTSHHPSAPSLRVTWVAKPCRR